jgi:hypothetical protein
VATNTAADVSATEHARALEWALAQARARRHEIPLGSNRGPFVERCQHVTDLPGTGWPWCVAFFAAAWRYGAGVEIFYRAASALGFLEAARKAGHAVPLAKAEPGDAIIFKDGAGHCAMLRAKWTGGTVVETVDGNWADRVERVNHPASSVAGAIHLPDPRERRKTKPTRPHLFEVTTSASGHRKRIYVGTRKAISGRLARLLDRFPRITITPRRSP